ncbi:MAG TPA: BON domain-containing protein [Vicinamibacterales bacterium]|nr:BON domain-containing protein [Vicinamibacterales bacterium]
MLGTLFRAIVILVIVVAAVAFFAGYRFSGGRVLGPSETTPAVGTTGQQEPAIDRSTARERGAQAGEKVADAGNRAAEFISDASLTAKIKSKMALDDTVKALQINVTTNDGTVTLSGDVNSEQEHQRALALARETKGVRHVTDQLRVK